jgi:hypothetical protein
LTLVQPASSAAQKAVWVELGTKISNWCSEGGVVALG